jgi:hypothetical protein
MNKPNNPPPSDAPLQPGDIVVATEKWLPKVQRMYPHIRKETQLRVTDFVGKAAYGRKAIFVVAKPGGDPICLFRCQVKRLPHKSRVSDMWVKDGMAQWIP